jgi:hypothetical protein
MEDVLLVTRSLQETLWRIEEARLGFRGKSPARVHVALRWILNKQGLKGSYRGLFAPTQRDISEGLRLLTGERIGPNRRAAMAHVLGEEALRALTLWKADKSQPYKNALSNFGEMVDGAKNGRYCCFFCTVGFLRGLTAARPSGWEAVARAGVNGIKRWRSEDGRWHGFPYYYTLLTLSGMDLPSARVELKYASKTAEGLIKRNRGEDRASRFRRLGLEAALNAS